MGKKLAFFRKQHYINITDMIISSGGRVYSGLEAAVYERYARQHLFRSLTVQYLRSLRVDKCNVWSVTIHG